MGHMLATVNPDAADAIGHEHDMDQGVPDIGETVVFHPRVGEWRAGRNKFAAIVTWVHDDGTLDLVVFYDADDFIGQRSVPRREGDGRGWVAVTRDSGPSMHPGGFLTDSPQLKQIFDRLTALENRPKPGRPKKPRPQV
jgi:hypothetical protein